MQTRAATRFPDAAPAFFLIPKDKDPRLAARTTRGVPGIGRGTATSAEGGTATGDGAAEGQIGGGAAAFRIGRSARVRGAAAGAVVGRTCRDIASTGQRARRSEAADRAASRTAGYHARRSRRSRGAGASTRIAGSESGRTEAEGSRESSDESELVLHFHVQFLCLRFQIVTSLKKRRPVDPSRGPNICQGFARSTHFLDTNKLHIITGLSPSNKEGYLVS